MPPIRSTVWRDHNQSSALPDKVGGRNIFWKPADGSGSEQTVLTLKEHSHVTAWSPDGQVLALEETHGGTGRDIWTVALGSDHKHSAVLQTQFNKGSPGFSPDGRWLAYISDQSGRNEVYVQPYPGPGGKWQISTEGGVEPAWARNGRELFFRSGNKIMAVDVTTQPTFTVSKPKVLFGGQYETTGGNAWHPNYDVSADGQKFLMVQAEEAGAAASQINVVLNWFEELKKKVPTGK